MNQNYLVFYSKKCRHSEEFLNQLHRNHLDLYKQFKQINIDNTSVKLPNYIKVVPTIIVPTVSGKNTMFAGNDVFKWLDSISQQKIQQPKQAQAQAQAQADPINGTMGGGINNFDPFQMGGFSTYSSLEGDMLSEGTGFSLFSKDRDYTLGITAPPEEAFKSDKLKSDSTARTLEDYQAERDRDIRPPIQRQGGTPAMAKPNFSSPY